MEDHKGLWNPLELILLLIITKFTGVSCHHSLPQIQYSGPTRGSLVRKV